jgi:hypothetical protein
LGPAGPWTAVAARLGFASEEAALLALQAAQDFHLPALLDPLDRSRREVNRRSVLQPRAHPIPPGRTPSSTTRARARGRAPEARWSSCGTRAAGRARPRRSRPGGPAARQDSLRSAGSYDPAWQPTIAKTRQSVVRGGQRHPLGSVQGDSAVDDGRLVLLARSLAPMEVRSGCVRVQIRRTYPLCQGGPAPTATWRHARTGPTVLVP